MRAGECAALSLLAAAATYDALAKEGEQITDANDRFRARHPLLGNAAIAITAAHLSRITPRRYDPFSLIGTIVRAVRSLIAGTRTAPS